MTGDQRAAWVALAQIPGIGPVRLHDLLEAFASPLGAISAPFEFLCAVPGITRAAATAIKATSLQDGARLIEQARHAGGQVLLPMDPEFPPLLAHIPDSPPVLFARGKLELLARPAAAVVGSRDHSAYGGEVTRQAAWELAAAGVVVVSGMARGLDAVAHEASLDAGGGTIGVLGNGLGVVYPAANRRLYERVAAEGLLLTEFPPGERPHAASFPRRNRIISGLARVTVVVEAGQGSGALITADTALNQGREVMVVPGPITSPQSIGANRLIRDGATPLLEMRELLEHYPDVEPPARVQVFKLAPGQPPPVPLPDSLDAGERTVAEMLGPDPVALDELIARSGRSARELLALLCGLEIAGVVEQRPGRRFRRL